MRKYFLIFTSIWLSILIVHYSHSVPVAAQSKPVVRAILFYSPTCPHCARVIQEDLPPLFEHYDTQLQIIGIDVSSPDGAALYQVAIEHFKLPEERMGVPTMIIDTWVLVGSGEIPEQFPNLVEYYLSQGGVDWPDIPGLREALAAPKPTDSQDPPPENESPALPEPTPELAAVTQPESETTTPAPDTLLIAEHDTPTWRENFVRDTKGNTLSIIVLIGMIAVFGISIARLFGGEKTLNPPNSWIFPLLCLIGFGVAGYLAYVETSNTSAVCGPVGDCNTVQQSEYARLFGFLPIGVLGLVFYFTIFLTWLIHRQSSGNLRHLAAMSLLGMTFMGIMFSIYLTFLEPFVIGATCAWCLTSAVVMTALCYLSLSPGKQALIAIQEKR